MKRITLILFIALASILPAKAQRFKVGLLAGVDITDVDGADLTDNDNDFSKFGFTLGGYVNTQLTQKSIVQMEIVFAQKGSSQAPDSTNNNDYYRLALNYVDMTFLYRHTLPITIGKKPIERFELEAGLTFGYLFEYSYTVKSINYVPLIPSNTFDPIDLSPMVGLVYNFSPSFSLDLRYSNSIIPVIRHENSNSQFLYYGSWNRGNNLVFQILFRYTFGTGGQVANASSDTDRD